jgi:PiT family inorganic phosphate transporter
VNVRHLLISVSLKDLQNRTVNEMVIMVVAWIMTIPCTAAVGGLAYMVLTSLFGSAL